MPYSNDPQPNPYVHIPSPFPNIDFPVPFWINKLRNMAIVGCLDPDLVYAELAVAAAANMMWTVETPSSKQLMEQAGGASWLCGSRQVISNMQQGTEIANSGTGRFIYGALKGVDIATYFAFMISTGAKGVIDFGSYAAKFQRKCNGDQSKFRGLNPVGGWPADTHENMIGPEFITASGGTAGPILFLKKNQIGALIAWCNFSILGGTGGLITKMSIRDADTGEVFDSSTVNNLFSLSQYAVVRYFTTEGRSDRDRQIELRVEFLETVGTRAVPVNGGCYIRSWLPTAADAPPYWDMKTMLKSK